MKLVNYDRFSRYPVFSNRVFGKSIIYDVNGTLVKQPKNISNKAAYNKKLKLEILKENPNDFYVDVLEVYGRLIKLFSAPEFFAFQMPKLENNLLKRYKTSDYSMSEKNELLLKINELVINGNAEGIYNHDIWLRNFHLSTDGKLTGLDVDSLAVGLYNSGVLLTHVIDSKVLKNSKNIDNQHLQNISMLRCCLALWCNPIIERISLIFHNYPFLIDILDVDRSLKQMMFDVFECKDVDMSELISHMPNNGKYLKRSL